MNCAKHTEVPAAAFCRTCGKALCETCKRDVRGVIYCEDCLATRVQGTMPPASVAPMTAQPGAGPHPAVAGVLAGFFPFGVGQAYNGQYSRGFAYMLIFIGLIYGASSAHSDAAGAVFGLGIAAFYFFQLIDAVRSAHFLRAGSMPPDPFGLDNIFGAGGKPHVTNRPGEMPIASWPQPNANAAAPAGAAPADTAVAETQNDESKTSNIPVAAAILIGLGILFLLGNLGLVHAYWIGDFWPLVFLGVGGWLLANRWNEITSGTPRGRRQLMWPAVLLVVGVTLFLDHHGSRFGLEHSWPLILIVIGLVLFWQRTAPTPPQAPPPMPPAPGTGTTSQITSGETVEAAPEREGER